jgi:hypothetical protein
MSKKTGYASIFSFPYYLLASEPLPRLDGAHRGRRYRIHEPFLMRPNGSPLSQSVPLGRWPNFRWSPALPAHKRTPPAQGLGGRIGAPYFYDGLRIDCWGSRAETEVNLLVRRFLFWLRRLSFQPWIGDIDRFFEDVEKHGVHINDGGDAVDSPYSKVRAHIPEGIEAITVHRWSSAFTAALTCETIRPYWNTFFDGINATAREDYASAVLGIVIALEGARDWNLSRLVGHQLLGDTGFRLDPPFDHTDLLKHLSRDTRARLGRDFSTERPQEWGHLRNAYIARHHVAHGKGPLFPTPNGLVKVSEETFRPWPHAVRTAVQWLEALSDS